MHLLHPLLVFLLLAAPLTTLRGQESDIETRLRETLRNTMLQLREAQARTAEMEAASVLSQQETERTKSQLSAMQDQLVAERNLNTNLRSELQQAADRAAAQQARIAKGESDYRKVVLEARKAQNSLGQARLRITELERLIAEQQVKNVELKTVADEILDRYTRHSLGTALLAREPFVGTNRAKLQTLLQDLETRIRAAGLNP